MAKDAADVWRECFQNWPAGLPRRGVLIMSFNEQIPFERFFAGDEMLLVERRAPDTVGARMVMFTYAKIEGVKIVDVVQPKSFASLGFAMPAATPAPKK